MAARPNTTRTIAYGSRIARMQVARLADAVAKAENAIATNALLTKEEVELYKGYIKLCNKQSRLFTDIANLEVPAAPKTPKRKPGRPSYADLEAAAASRKGKAVIKAAAKPAKSTKVAKPAKAAKAAKVATATVSKPAAKAAKAKAPTVVLSTEPKRRGRPPKAKPEAATVAAATAVAAPVVTPKRRGRPPKVKVEVAAPAVAAAPKRRGRPPKAKPESAGTNGASTAVKLIATEAPALGTMLSSENN